MTQLRKRIISSRKYNPTWNGFIEGYTVNFLKKNFWRVQAHMEYNDCLQEAQLLFVKLKKMYGNLDAPQHFMALYRTSWERRFNGFAKRDGKYRIEISDSQIHKTEDFNYTDTMLLVSSDTENDGMLAIMIEQAPQEIKQILKLFLTTPVEVLDQMTRMWKRKGKHKDFGNQHMCKILGIKEGTDIEGMMREYFK